MRHVFAGGLLSVCLWVPGCGLVTTELDKCREQREYQAAEIGPRLRVPDDLEAPDENAWLPVPYGEAQKSPVPESDPCLIEPPAYREESEG